MKIHLLLGIISQQRQLKSKRTQTVINYSSEIKGNIVQIEYVVENKLESCMKTVEL